MSQIFIAGGVTSNLFSALLPSLIDAKHTLFATVRTETNPDRIRALSEHGIQFITKEESLNKMFDAVLWMSTHDDIEYLTLLSERSPTLAISSAAIMDYYFGIESEEQLNAYKRSKLALSRVPEITTLIPGFYIEDVATPQWASRGLHGDTTKKLFAKKADAAFDWNKSYSVTPKSLMVLVINRWLNLPHTFAHNEPIIVCSDRVYRRWELRAYSRQPHFPGAQYLSPITDEIYSKFPHATYDDGTSIVVNDANVRHACAAAASSF